MGATGHDATTEGVDRLDGWKEIAAYLRASKRTVERWADELGLPVYRVGRKVRAERPDLDAWERRFKASQATPLRLVSSGGGT